MKARTWALLVLVPSFFFTGASFAFGAPKESAGPVRFGLQMADDSYFGILVRGEIFELGLKAQCTVFDGFLSNVKPDDLLMVGGHACYLLGPWYDMDWGIGIDGRQGIILSGDTKYEQFLDAALRIGCNAFLGDHFMISGIFYPIRISIRETDQTDSYSLSVTIPAAGLAVAVLF